MPRHVHCVGIRIEACYVFYTGRYAFYLAQLRMTDLLREPAVGWGGAQWDHRVLLT